ncbi:MAG: hypothetical protein CMJ89_16760 [Planctomycetes bacterium]|jgi:anaerobic selenocysteine-containing dehydrogenase|nr:hypothetical protein [Planctomycetota bacterium]
MSEPNKVLTSACPLDCPDGCSLSVTIEDARVTRIAAGTANPSTGGYICSKVRGFAEHMYHSARLRSPLIRVSGASPPASKGSCEFREATWDEALDRIVEALREVCACHGPEAVLPFCYGGSNGRLTQDSADAALFRRLGASIQLRTVCAVPTSMANAGMYGSMPGVALQDFEQAQAIVVWGANPHGSGIHLVPHVLKAKGKGAKLLVVDPRRTSLAKKADHHLALRPGTDLPLGLSILNWFFKEGYADRDFLAQHASQAEELERRCEPWTFARAADVCQLKALDIEAFARTYAESDPAVLRCGWGPERSRSGGSAICSILALPAVAGKFGKRGGGFLMSNAKAFAFGAATDDRQPPTREINMNHLGRVLLGDCDPPVGALFVYNANPLSTLPDQERVRRGLMREDLFTVVFDQMLTDTARYADVILPATVFLEHHELSTGYGTFSAQYAQPLVEPLDQARPNYEVFGELIERMGLSRPGDDFSPEGMLRAFVPESDRREELVAGESLVPDEGRRPVQFVDSFPRTPDRRIHLVPETLDREVSGGLYHYLDENPQDNYPLALISPATSRTVSTMFGQLNEDEVPLALHPQDADARGLKDGDAVVAFNDLGRVETSLVLDGDLKVGVAYLPKGVWSKSTRNGNTSNALVPDSLSDLGGGACFNDARVEVRRA